MPAAPDRIAYSPAEAARAAGVSLRTVRAWLSIYRSTRGRSGLAHCLPSPRCCRILASDLFSFLSASRPFVPRCLFLFFLIGLTSFRDSINQSSHLPVAPSCPSAMRWCERKEAGSVASERGPSGWIGSSAAGEIGCLQDVASCESRA